MLNKSMISQTKDGDENPLTKRKNERIKSQIKGCGAIELNGSLGLKTPDNSVSGQFSYLWFTEFGIQYWKTDEFLQVHG